VITHDGEEDHAGKNIIVEVPQGVRNPTSTRQSGTFKITTYAKTDSDNSYHEVEIDESLTVTPNTLGELTNARVTRSEAKQGNKTDLEVCFTTSNEVQQGSTLTIDFPIDQIVVSDQLEADVTFTVDSQTATVFFLDEGIEANEEWCINFTGGLKNPRNLLQPTSSFTLTTLTAGDFGIDTLTSGITASPEIHNRLCPGVEMTETSWWNRFLVHHFCD